MILALGRIIKREASDPCLLQLLSLIIFDRAGLWSPRVGARAVPTARDPTTRALERLTTKEDSDCHHRHESCDKAEGKKDLCHFDEPLLQHMRVLQAASG